MKRSARRLLWAVVLVLVSSTSGFAQGASQSLSGVVVDAAGGVIPGATVVVLNKATGEKFELSSNEAGAFSVPGIAVGTYTVTVTLQSFKTAVINDVRIVTGTAANVRATMELGALSETVQVSSRAELVQSQSPSVASTLVAEQLNEVPLASRNALYALNMLPGVQYGSGAGPRAAGINGLPNNTVNITIDGVQTGNMLQSTDGFFSMVTPRLDAVEEITITGAVPGSGSGPGSVQVQFATRSGTNRFDGSAYHYWKQPDFNSNYYFNKVNNLPKNEVVAHQYGFRQGGPIVIPGLYDGRNKAFFFFNFERLYQPSSATRTRTMLRPEAQAGIFGYNVTVGGAQQRQTVDLLALAQRNGQISALDPTMVRLLDKIRTGAQSTGTINDTGAGSTLQYVFQSEALGNQYAPTGRVDINVTDNHRLSGSYWWQRFTSTTDLLNNVDRAFPGLSNFGTQNSYRTTGNSTLRSTLSPNLVNELRGGWQWSPNDFFANVNAEQFAEQDGFALSFAQVNSANFITNPTVTNNPQPRNTTTWSIDNTLNWLRGAHSVSMGGGYAGVMNRQNSFNAVTPITLGFDANTDPAAGMFTTTNFPSATANQLNEARALYAILTGRVSSIPGTARLDSATGSYVFLGDLARKSRQSSFSAFISDQWRATPTLTISGGVRWDLHNPFTPADETWSLATIEDICGISGTGDGPGDRGCNIFDPRAQSGALIPAYDHFDVGVPAHKTNWFDFAPNVGVAWRPNVQGGWLKALLGDPEQAVVRAGYALSYNQERIDRFTANAGANPGGTLGVTRDLGTGYPLVLPGESAPVLLSQRSRLGPPAYPEAPVYPIAATTANSVNIFPQDRHLVTPRVHSYSVGVQRSIGTNMAFEARYVGNKNTNTWAEEDWNERSVFNSGFYNEFQLAQRNIAANIAAGLGSRGFAYTGAPGTSPLPIHLAYLQAGNPNPNNPANYTSTNFTNQAFVNRFSALRPQVTAALSAIDTAAFRANAQAAGLARNLIVMNPMVSSANVVMDSNWTKYNSLQLELRRRLSQGLLIGANYTYGIKETSLLTTLASPRVEVDASDDRNSPHAFKVNWDYELPIGRDRRFGSNMNPVLNAVVGGWQFSGSGLVKRDRYRLIGVKLEGMTAQELQDEFKIHIDRNATGQTVVFSFPEDIRLNTWAAFSVDPTTPTGYSAARGVPTGRYLRPSSEADCIAIYRFDCDTPDINLNGPLFSRWDMRLKKSFGLGGRRSFEIMAEVLNVFDTINFNHGGPTSTIQGGTSLNPSPNNGEDTFRVTSAYTDINTTFDPGGRVGQLVWRLNW